ncbi:MAG: HEAT repeat domain-containing protein, partial [Nitrospirae bacterium]
PEEALAALERLAAGGILAARALAREFPGPLRKRVGAAAHLAEDPFEHGPLIGAMARLGTTARPVLLALAADPSRWERRLFALYLLARIPSPQSLPLLLEALSDEEPRVAAMAREALKAHRDVPGFAAALSDLRAELGRRDALLRLGDVIRTVGQLRDVESIPRLIELLDHRERDIVREAEQALVDITKQSFGSSQRRWRKWWEAHREEPRFAWLIEGLEHKHRHVRFSAAVELERMTGETFGYYFDAPKAERDAAVARWRAWWAEARKV